MKAIVTGESKHVEALVRENRIRAARGLLKFEIIGEKGTKEKDTKKTDEKDKKTMIEV